MKYLRPIGGRENDHLTLNDFSVILFERRCGGGGTGRSGISISIDLRPDSRYGIPAEPSLSIFDRFRGD